MNTRWNVVGSFVFSMVLLMGRAASAAPLTYDFCPQHASCAPGVTEASLTFVEIAGGDPNDYTLTTVFRGDATAVSSVDAWSFAVNGVATPAGYTGTPSLTSAPAAGAPWVVSFDNISNNACANGAQATEVCVESTGAVGALLTSATQTWILTVNFADGIPVLTTSSLVQLRARFQPSGILSPGFHPLEEPPDDDSNGRSVAEPTTMMLFALGLSAAAVKLRR